MQQGVRTKEVGKESVCKRGRSLEREYFQDRYYNWHTTKACELEHTAYANITSSGERSAEAPRENAKRQRKWPPNRSGCLRYLYSLESSPPRSFGSRPQARTLSSTAAFCSQPAQRSQLAHKSYHPRLRLPSQSSPSLDSASSTPFGKTSALS